MVIRSMERLRLEVSRATLTCTTLAVRLPSYNSRGDAVPSVNDSVLKLVRIDRSSDSEERYLLDRNDGDTHRRRYRQYCVGRQRHDERQQRHSDLSTPIRTPTGSLTVTSRTCQRLMEVSSRRSTGPCWTRPATRWPPYRSGRSSRRHSGTRSSPFYYRACRLLSVIDGGGTSSLSSVETLSCRM